MTKFEVFEVSKTGEWSEFNYVRVSIESNLYVRFDSEDVKYVRPAK